MINKRELKRKAKTAFRIVMQNSPMELKRYLTGKKIEQISKFLISPSELKICEEDYERRFEMINRQKTKYPERVKLLEDNIQKIVSDPGNSFDSAEAVRLRNQIEYAYFAYGFSPKEYVYFHLEEKDMRTFVSDIERRCMKFAMNDFTQYVFADKAKAYEYFRKWYNRDAVAVETKNDFSAFEEFVIKHPTFVVKKVNSSQGKEVWVQTLSENPRQDFERLIKYGKIILEEIIKQGEETEKFNRSSINTVRAASFLTHSGVVVDAVSLRTGRQGSFVDNAGAGGVSSLVDANTGVLFTDGFDKQGNKYAFHPDSGVAFKDYKLPRWDEALKLLKDASLLFPEMKYKSFDLAYSNKGWVIVEINPSGELVRQMCLDIGLKEKIQNIMDNMDLMYPYSFR